MSGRGRSPISGKGLRTAWPDPRGFLRFGYDRHPWGCSVLSPYPKSVWTSCTSVFVLAVVVIPLLGTLLLAQGLRSVSGLATATQFVVLPVVLGASILLYVQYRLTGSDAIGWATVCLTQYAVQGFALAGLRAATGPETFSDRANWVLIIDIPASLLILGFLHLSGRVRLAVDPLGTGLLLGLLVACANLGASLWGPPLSLTSRPAIGAQVALVVVGLGIANAAYRLEGIPPWFAVRLGLGAFALVVNHVASTRDALDAVAVASGVIGAVLMVNASGAALRWVIQEQRQSLLTLSDQVATLAEHERDSRARLHEVTNSMAAIAVASSLIHQHGEVPPHKRERLERMLDSEASRLTRILAGKGNDALADAAEDGATHLLRHPLVVDLDEVIEPLVTAQEAQGRQVEWRPTGLRAHGDPDAVAEVVSILLDNSAQHAPGSRTSIDVTQDDDRVEVVVSDDGPGIPAELRGHVFEWGGRGPHSQGQGIGLHVADQLMNADGSSLRLERKDSGIAFVIDLPAAEESAS